MSPDWDTTDNERSLMIVTSEEEYCFLYNRQTLPQLLERLLSTGRRAPSNFEEYYTEDEESLNSDHFRSIALDMIGRRHSSI